MLGFLWKSAAVLKDTRPCSACGMAAKIKLDQALGSYCLWYQVRISPDELSERKTPLRARCITDGNNFIWPLVGVKSVELVNYKRDHHDWYIKRTSLKVGMVIAVVSVVVGLVSVVLR